MILEITGLETEREHMLLRDIDWQVKSGENWCVFGPNASGKTALASVMSHYAGKVSGEIRLFGRPYSAGEWKELKKQVILLDPKLCMKILPSMKGTEVICAILEEKTTGSTYRSAVEKRRALDMLKQCSCEHLGDRLWRQMTPREKRMVLLASALTPERRLILMDDMCSDLDPFALKRFLNDLETLVSGQDMPAFILFVRSVNEVIPSVSHVLILKEGRIFSRGKKLDVLNSEILSKLFETSVLCDYNKGTFNVEFLI
ncbi:MAG: ATP-binding cassette domain-containing protein [FCB group bacterium]|nr:ATP-binding cassette domain-containing protein [FCB group bacterium]